MTSPPLNDNHDNSGGCLLDAESLKHLRVGGGGDINDSDAGKGGGGAAVAAADAAADVECLLIVSAPVDYAIRLPSPHASPPLG